VCVRVGVGDEAGVFVLLGVDVAGGPGVRVLVAVGAGVSVAVGIGVGVGVGINLMLIYASSALIFSSPSS